MFDFQIFLSHAAADAANADEVRAALIDAGHSVYCDRHDDPLLDRRKVTRATAERLRHVMRRCNMLLYVISENAALSRWMPWELGFFDGCRGKVLVYPVSAAAQARAANQQYLSLFEILAPGSLAKQVAAALTAAGEPARAETAMQPIAAMVREARLFGPGDHAATAVYGERLSATAGKPLDLKAAMAVQQEIANAWLRLWSLGR